MGASLFRLHTQGRDGWRIGIRRLAGLWHAQRFRGALCVTRTSRAPPPPWRSSSKTCRCHPLAKVTPLLMPCALACSLALSSRRPSSCYVDWYLIPDSRRGQLLSDDDVYLRVTRAPRPSGGRLVGEENEEYSSEWSSDWRTWELGKGRRVERRAAAGHHAIWAACELPVPLPDVADAQFADARQPSPCEQNGGQRRALLLHGACGGRKAEDSPDAFAFLASTRLLADADASAT